MATAQQKARAEVYRDAAVEHITVAQELYDLERFVLANYIAGPAAECMLRAYRHMIDAEFDSRHELGRLYRLVVFADVVPRNRVEQVTAALEQVISLWSNEHRFLSNEALRRRWARRRMYQGIKGDFVKELVRRLINAAGVIVSIGAAKWNSSFKN